MSTNIIHLKSINDNTLSHLNQYLKAGFNVIPLKERDKVPAVKAWKPLLKQPLTVDKLKEIYQTNPKLNIGLLTGPSSGGLIVIDIDHSPPEELAFLIAENPTATIRTSRGRHYYYLSETKLTNLIFDWGELRANGIYVVAPPSVHPDGTEYGFFDGLGLTEITPIPKTILNYLGCSKILNSKAAPKSKDRDVDQGGVVRITFNSCYSIDDTLRDFEIAKKVMGLCGCEVEKIGQTFHCPLHGDSKPSVSLWNDINGKIVLHEFHRGDKFLTLAEVYASFISGKDIKLKKGELIIWWLRALEDISYIKPPLITAKELPANVSESAKKLYLGFIRLLRLRKMYDPKQTAAPFSWSFALNWCGIGSMATVSKSMKWLLGNGYLKMVEKGCKIGEGTKAALFILGKGEGKDG